MRFRILCWACVVCFSFVLMEDRRCLYRQLHSLPHDNVLSQGGGPLAVEGVLLNSDVIYHVLLCPTPSVTYRCQLPPRGSLWGKFSYFGEIDFSLPKLVQFSRSAVIKNVRTAHTNAVFFPSAQMKNIRYKPYIPTETRAIPARTQSTQTPHRSGD